MSRSLISPPAEPWRESSASAYFHPFPPVLAPPPRHMLPNHFHPSRVIDCALPLSARHSSPIGLGREKRPLPRPALCTRNPDECAMLIVSPNCFGVNITVLTCSLLAFTVQQRLAASVSRTPSDGQSVLVVHTNVAFN